VRSFPAFLLAGAIAVFAPGALADPEETDPDLARRDADYAAGVQAVKDKRWPEAVAKLKVAERRNPDSADLHNFLGFAYRSQKQFEPAFAHYKRALEIDPRHRGAHEYIGEAYLMTNDLAGAQKHLELLRGICLLGCEELADLEKAIAAYKAKR
jgi:tetratricopeptide (TPR) repeat protein